MEKPLGFTCRRVSSADAEWFPPMPFGSDNLADHIIWRKKSKRILSKASAG
jgi:hypothetical protein